MPKFCFICKLFFDVCLFFVSHQVRENKIVLVFCYRGDGEAIAFLQNFHVRQFWVLSERSNGNQLYGSVSHNIDANPARIVFIRLWIVIVALGIKLSSVRFGFRSNMSQANNARLGTRRMVKKNWVSNLHFVSHKISGLIVSYAKPIYCSIRMIEDAFKRTFGWFGFH